MTLWLLLFEIGFVNKIGVGLHGTLVTSALSCSLNYNQLCNHNYNYSLQLVGIIEKKEDEKWVLWTAFTCIQ
jgi:hypothetical protein